MRLLRKRRPSHTKVLIDELAAYLEREGGSLAAMGGDFAIASAAVRFVTERYPQPHRTQVMCDQHGGLTPLMHIHRREVTQEPRWGTADCDVNPIRSSGPWHLFLCDECAAEFDEKHKGPVTQWQSTTSTP